MGAADERNGASEKKPGNGAGALSIYKLHRWIGLVSAALFVILAITGPLLMHGKNLRLNEQWVASELVLALYDTEPAGRPRGVATEAGWVLAVDGVFVLDQRMLGRDQGELVGAAVAGDYLVVASDLGLSLFARDGAPIEHFDNDMLPGPVLRLGTAADGVVIETPSGAYGSDDDYLSWRAASDAVAWVAVDEQPPAEQAKWALDAYRHHLVTLHRLMTDIHSGRIVGSLGPYLMDAAAIAMLLMVASGLGNWWKYRRRG